MVLLLLHDGSHIEIPGCQDVVHKLNFLVFLDQMGASLVCLPVEDIVGYTLKPRIAHLLTDPAAAAGLTRSGRRRRAEPEQA